MGKKYLIFKYQPNILNKQFCNLFIPQIYYHQKLKNTMTIHRENKTNFNNFSNFNLSHNSYSFIKIRLQRFSILESKKNLNSPSRLNFKKLDTNDLNFFQEILTRENMKIKDIEFYNTDWTKKFFGNSSLVLQPKTTEQVSSILKYCNSQNLAVVPQSGNTGLVGG